MTHLFFHTTTTDKSPYCDDPTIVSSNVQSTPIAHCYTPLLQYTLVILLLQYTLIIFPLLHFSIQFAHWKQWQVVPSINQTYCYNDSTVLLLFLQLYLIYFILIYAIYLLQFVDCLQPQVVILLCPYYIKLDAISHIFVTTTTTKSTTKYSLFQVDIY